MSTRAFQSVLGQIATDAALTKHYIREELREVRLKNIGAVLIAVLALAVMLASSASAANFETAHGTWEVNGASLVAGKGVACEIDPSTVITLKTTVGKYNTPFKLQATGITCPGGEIFNEGEEAKFTGHIRFTGVTVLEPSGCSVEGGAIETVAVKGSVGMMVGSSATDTVNFEPASRAEFAEFGLTGCTLAGSYPIKGRLIGQPTNVTCTEAAAQTVDFSEAIQNDAGGAFIFGNRAAQIEGELSVKLTSGGNFTACSS